jgi:anti-sigma factor RsiW
MGGKSMLMPNTIHPTSRTLLAYLDAELPIDERLEVRTHVAGCQTCRDELDAMEADLDWFLVLEAASRTVKPQVHADGVSRLLAATRAWQNSCDAAAAAEEEKRRAVEQRAEQALELFFGPKVAEAARTHGEAESAESLLATFLGKRAADALMTDIRRGKQPPRLASDVS